MTEIECWNGPAPLSTIGDDDEQLAESNAPCSRMAHVLPGFVGAVVGSDGHFNR
jgi:hypothetical protein